MRSAVLYDVEKCTSLGCNGSVRRRLVSSIFRLRAKLSGAVYCYQSCLQRAAFVALSVCYHDNSKLRASIFTKLGLKVKVVTISS